MPAQVLVRFGNSCRTTTHHPTGVSASGMRWADPISSQSSTSRICPFGGSRSARSIRCKNSVRTTAPTGTLPPTYTILRGWLHNAVHDCSMQASATEVGASRQRSRSLRQMYPTCEPAQHRLAEPPRGLTRSDHEYAPVNTPTLIAVAQVIHFHEKLVASFSYSLVVSTQHLQIVHEDDRRSALSRPPKQRSHSPSSLTRRP